MRRIAVLAAMSVLSAATLLAQTVEYGRTSGADLDMTTRHSSGLSGSFLLGTGGNRGASLGGTIVKDRVWFFASGQRSESLVRATAVPAPAIDLSAALANVRPPAPAPMATSVTMPSSFLSLHSTAIVSPNSFFTFDLSRSKR